MTPLGDVATISSGFPFRKKVESEPGGDLVLVQIKDVDDTEGLSRAGEITLRSESGRYDRYLLRPGDLLFQSRGSRHPVAVVESAVRGIAASGLHVIRLTADAVLPAYLAWWLNQPECQARLRNAVAHGTYVPFVSTSDLKNFAVLVPPLEMQRRIVEVDLLRRRERVLSQRLQDLTQQLIDGVTLLAASRR
jgi:restriction endonuclease S subunit